MIAALRPRSHTDTGVAWLAELRLRYAALADQPATVVDRTALAHIAVKLAELTALVKQDVIPQRDAALLPRLATWILAALDEQERQCAPAPLPYPVPPRPARSRSAALLQVAACYRGLFGVPPTMLGTRRLDVLLARHSMADVLAALRYCARREGRVRWSVLEALLESRLVPGNWSPRSEG